MRGSAWSPLGPLHPCKVRAHTDDLQMNEHGCFPIKLYLLQQLAGQVRPLSAHARALCWGLCPDRPRPRPHSPELLSWQEQNPLNLRGCTFRSPTKKHQSGSPNRDYAFNTLTQLEMDLVKFVSKVRNLKVAMAANNNLRLQSLEAPPDPQNNITIYEIWGEEDE